MPADRSPAPAPGRRRPEPLPLAWVAKFAEVTEAMARRAVADGAISKPYGVPTVVALRVYASLADFPWPGESRARNEKSQPQLRDIVTIPEQVSMLASDPEVGPEATMWVTPVHVVLARTQAERLEVEMGLRGELLADDISVRIAVGRWIADARSKVAAAPKARRSAARAPNAAIGAAA